LAVLVFVSGCGLEPGVVRGIADELSKQEVAAKLDSALARAGGSAVGGVIDTLTAARRQEALQNLLNALLERASKEAKGLGSALTGEAMQARLAAILNALGEIATTRLTIARDTLLSDYVLGGFVIRETWQYHRSLGVVTNQIERMSDKEGVQELKPNIKARSEKSKTERTLQRVLRSQGN